MAKTRVFYKMPDGTFIRKEKSGRTRYIQHGRTGRLKGRKRVPPSQSDGTGVRRVEKDFTLVRQSVDKRGHIRRKRVHMRDGFILGRTPS